MVTALFVCKNAQKKTILKYTSCTVVTKKSNFCNI